MLVQIGQNSAAVTPFGSLGSVGYSANANGVGQSVVVDRMQSERRGVGFATYLQQCDSRQRKVHWTQTPRLIRRPQQHRGATTSGTDVALTCRCSIDPAQ